MPNVSITPLVTPTADIAEAFTRWENDPALIPFSRPNRNQHDLEQRAIVTLDAIAQRLTYHHIYLIYRDTQLIGEMSYQVDPPHLLKKEADTAWIGITIGESDGRGRGIGHQALHYLEQQIQLHKHKRIELGVFEFNTPAIALYRKLHYQEIGRIADFTYWNGRMWHDIRMEKYLKANAVTT